MVFLSFSISTWKTKTLRKKSWHSVNALYRAFSISTAGLRYGRCQSLCVSMPFIGLSPFLLLLWKDYLMFYQLVSMPFIGLSPFLLSMILTLWRCYASVSMPFIGLPPFLQTFDLNEDTKVLLCQCPLSGFLHFYRNVQRVK